MASQNTFEIPPLSPGSHGNVVIRMRRKRQAPPLESFVVESTSSDGVFVKPKPKSQPRKTIFTRTSSIDMTSPIKNEIARMLENESDKQSNYIGGKMKKLKLGELELGNDLSPTFQVPKPNPDLTNPTPGTNADKVHVFDILKDTKTDALSIKSVSTPLDPTTATHVVTCNGEEMIREKAPNTPPKLDEHNYVYDLYYTENADLSMFDDPNAILINPLDYDITWVDPFTDQHSRYDEDYNDDSLSDDSNKESNWRNEYGDSGSENEIDRMHYSKYGSEQGEYYLPDFDDPEGVKNLWIQDPGTYNYNENDEYGNGSDLSDEGY